MVQFLKSKRNIALTMHINDVFAMNSKMRNETSFEMKQKKKIIIYKYKKIEYPD